MSASRRAAFIALGALIGCNVVAALSATFILPADWSHGTPDFSQTPLTRAWVHWDAGWYSGIARDGYFYKPGQQSSVAFFPTYPVTLMALVWLGVNRFVAGIAVTAIAGVLALWVHFRWARRIVDEERAVWATAMFALYPFALFLYGAMYSDALFALIVVGAFLCLEKDFVPGAILLGILATAARPVAPAVVIGLVARQIERRRSRGERIRVVDVLPGLAGLGLLAWMGWLGWKFGDPMAFATVQTAPGWDQAPGWQSWLKVELIEQLMNNPPKGLLWRTAVHGGLSVALLALVVPLWRRISKGYALYVLVVVGIPVLSTKDFMGLGRYGLAAFPVFLAVATLLKDRPRARWAYVAVSALGLCGFTLAFAADKYVS